MNDKRRAKRPFAGSPLVPHADGRGRRWSWKIGRIAGVDIRVHATFVLLLAWVGLGPSARERGPREALVGVAMAAAVFAFIALHELGHALVALRFGVRTRDILLLPIGGVARLEGLPEVSGAELAVAMAGTAVNAALALVLYVGLKVARIPPGLDHLTLTGGPIVSKLMWINIGLAAFNMVPAFPLDGGGALRGLLARRMPQARVTDLAANVGRSIAIMLGFAGLFVNPMLVLIAIFVLIGANEEAAPEHIHSALAGLTAGDAMITTFRVLSPNESVAFAVEHAVAGLQHDFPVVEDGRVVGVLTRVDVLRAIASNATQRAVSEFMRRDFSVADAAESLALAVERIDSATCPAVPVLRDGRLAGILTTERIGELVITREAE